jgi:hypothetical protein
VQSGYGALPGSRWVIYFDVTPIRIPTAVGLGGRGTIWSARGWRDERSGALNVGGEEFASSGWAA